MKLAAAPTQADIQLVNPPEPTPSLPTLDLPEIAHAQHITDGSTATRLWRGVHRSTGRQVVVKTLTPNALPRTHERFTAEGHLQQAAAEQMPHRIPHVVELITDRTRDGVEAIVMEALTPFPTEETEPQKAPISRRHFLSVMGQLLEALSGLEEMGIVHRDVKPQNLLRAPRRRVKLTDFGVAAVLPKASGQLKERDVEKHFFVGTPYFAPNEANWRRPGPPTPAFDTYSGGVTGYLLTTGRLPCLICENPVPSESRIHQHTPLSPARILPPGPHSDIEDLLRIMLEADPQKRPTPSEVYPLIKDAQRRRVRGALIPPSDTLR